MKTIHAWLFSIAITGICAVNALAEQPVKRNLINVVAVGYDIEQNAKAKQMLQEMAQAARDAGAVGEVIMSGQDQTELDGAMKQAMTIATQPPAEPAPKSEPATQDGWQSIGKEATPAQEEGSLGRQRQRKIPKGHSTPYGF